MAGKGADFTGDGSRPNNYGRDPILNSAQNAQLRQASARFTDPSYQTALQNRFEGDAGGYSGRNDLLQQAQMAQLMGVQGRQQQGAQQARGIQAKQQQEATAQRDRQVRMRKYQQSQQQAADMKAGVANRIGGASSEQLNASPQFQMALANALRNNPSLAPAPEPAAPAAPAAAPAPAPAPAAGSNPVESAVLNQFGGNRLLAYQMMNGRF